MSNLLEDVTYKDIPKDYKEEVNNGKLTQEEALRIHKDDLYFRDRDMREETQDLQDSQRA